MVPKTPAGVSAVMLCPLAQQSTPSVDNFRQVALRSSADALAAKFRVPLIVPVGWTAAEWTEALAGFSDVPLVTAYPPVGPLQIALRGMEADLKQSGHKLHYFRRQWDDLCWPHARKGFFPFKENIPAILREVGIS